MKYLEQANNIIKSDEWMMNVLRTAAKLQLKDWYIGAGFVRNKIWDVIHDIQTRTPLNDVDLVYFDQECTQDAEDKAFEKQLHNIMPDVPWSVKNQAVIHLRFNQKPFNSSAHAISFWPEIVTCVGVRLNLADDALEFTAPHGLDDIFELKVRPTQDNNVPLSVYQQRVKSKGWQKIWPKLNILGLDQ